MTAIVPNDDDPIWLRIAYGELQRGVHERRGSEDDPSILGYLSATSYDGPLHDEVPWCSAFACWCMERAGLRSTRAANARSWLDWGEPIAIARRGCVAVYSRGSSELAGHVGFLLQSLPRADVLLGGNQGDAVSIGPYPRARLLGYRWPTRIGVTRGPPGPLPNCIAIRPADEFVMPAQLYSTAANTLFCSVWPLSGVQVGQRR